MQALFMKEAEKNQVLPIDDRVFERVNAELVGRPDLMAGRTSITLAEGMTGMTENVFLNIKNKSKTITAEVEVPEGKTAKGIIIAQGGRFGGWALYAKDGVPAYDYNFLGLERFTVAATEKLKPGKSVIRFDFAYDGGGLGKGGMGTLYVNDKKVAEGRIERTQPIDLLGRRDGRRGHRLGDTGGRGDRVGSKVALHRQDPQGHRGSEGNEEGRQG